MLIVNVTDTEGKLPSHTACLRGATFEVIQLLFDGLVGDEQHHNGLSIADNRPWATSNPLVCTQ
jgi:hypothetical protein